MVSHNRLDGLSYQRQLLVSMISVGSNKKPSCR